MSRFDVGQPLGDDIQKGGIETDGSANDGDDYPALSGLVRGI